MESLLSALTQIPNWLTQFDQLDIPTWSVLVAILLAGFALVFSGREFFGWFLKTNSVIDSIGRIETQIRDLESELKSLDQAVRRLESTASPIIGDRPSMPTQHLSSNNPSSSRFPLSRPFTKSPPLQKELV